MDFGKMENHMDMDYIVLTMFFMLGNLETGLSMEKEYRLVVILKSMKGRLRLAKEKGKAFCILRKVSAIKVILKKL
jgi:hypothetical protein